MPSKLKFEVVATMGEYTASNGAVKKRYQRCGSVFENEKGHLSMKMDCIPAGPEWSGWFSFFEPKEREQGNQDSGNRQQRTPAHSSNQGGYGPDDPDTDIPFAPIKLPLGF